MGVILEGEEIERGYTRWPKATHRGRRPPAREASVPAPQGPRRRAAERLELLVVKKCRPLYGWISVSLRRKVSIGRGGQLGLKIPS